MGADENILNSSRATDFMTPKNKASLAFRDGVLELASEYEFARPLVNSGRLSKPTPYYDSPLSTPDRDEWINGPAPGHPCVDALVMDNTCCTWVLGALGNSFKLLHFGNNPPNTSMEIISVPTTGLAAERYDAVDGGTYLIRPDQVVAARWKNASKSDVTAAHKKALGFS